MSPSKYREAGLPFLYGVLAGNYSDYRPVVKALEPPSEVMLSDAARVEVPASQNCSRKRSTTKPAVFPAPDLFEQRTKTRTPSLVAPPLPSSAPRGANTLSRLFYGGCLGAVGVILTVCAAIVLYTPTCSLPSTILSSHVSRQTKLDLDRLLHSAQSLDLTLATPLITPISALMVELATSIPAFDTLGPYIRDDLLCPLQQAARRGRWTALKELPDLIQPVLACNGIVVNASSSLSILYTDAMKQTEGVQRAVLAEIRRPSQRAWGMEMTWSMAGVEERGKVLHGLESTLTQLNNTLHTGKDLAQSNHARHNEIATVLDPWTQVARLASVGYSAENWTGCADTDCHHSFRSLSQSIMAAVEVDAGGVTKRHRRGG